MSTRAGPPISSAAPHAASTDGRARILAAAIVLFAERGFAAVSISDVAQAAGMVKSAIYHHFSSKEALYLAVLRETVQQSTVQMAKAADGETWLERLHGAATSVARLVGPRSHVLSLILEGIGRSTAGVDPATAGEVHELRQEFLSVIRAEISAGIRAGELHEMDPVLASLSLVGLIAAVQQATEHPSANQAVDFAFHLFLDGAQVKKKRSK